MATAGHCALQVGQAVLCIRYLRGHRNHPRRANPIKTPQCGEASLDNLQAITSCLLPTVPNMTQPARKTTHPVHPIDWFFTYCVGVVLLALGLSLIFALCTYNASHVSFGNAARDVLTVASLLFAVSGVCIGVLAGVPSAIFFWVAHTRALHNVVIYLASGAISALPMIPVVLNLVPGLPATDTPMPWSGYVRLVLIFALCGAFLGWIYWFRTGRHLR